ncbi:MAG: hypothetical protein ACR2M7_03155 [Bdellovibrionales bacterium]
MNKAALWTKNWLEKRMLPHSFFEIVSSTNDIAQKKAFEKKFEKHIFLAHQQTQGRGQGSHSWENSDLMISFLWQNVLIPVHPKLSEEFTLELLISVKKVWPDLPWKLKKPNDLYLNDKKVAGLLLEILDQSSTKSFILGLGFNIFSHPKLNSNKANTLGPEIGHVEESTSVSQTQWNLFLDEINQAWNRKISMI